jgi:hypothetical protein
VYLDQLPSYESWVLGCIGGSIAVLVGGVVLLSMKKAPPATLPTSSDDIDAMSPADQEDGLESIEINDNTTTGGAAGRIKRLRDGVGGYVDSGLDDERVKEKRGFLGKFFGPSLGSSNLNTRDDEASVRRNRDGVQRLTREGDGDSIFAPVAEDEEVFELGDVSASSSKEFEFDDRGKRKSEADEDEDPFSDDGVIVFDAKKEGDGQESDPFGEFEEYHRV